MPSSSHRTRSRSPDRDRHAFSSTRHRSRSPKRERSSRDDRESARDRERERDRERHSSRRERDERDKGKDRSESEDEGGPPEGVNEIDESDFFLKSVELKVWLDEEKGKRLDQLKSEDARRYFKKFVRAWNRGRLPAKYYSGISSASISSSTNTKHVWTFAKATQRELDDAASVRKHIEDTGRRGDRDGPLSARTAGPALGPTMGPSMPSRVALVQNARESEQQRREDERAARDAERRRDRRAEREEERDNKATGRDRLLEKRAEGNAVRREIREGREGGGMMEVDEDTLMGGGSSFKAMVAARDARQTHGKRAQVQEERQAQTADRVQQYRTKEDDTMAMLRNLAASRGFGPQ